MKTKLLALLLVFLFAKLSIAQTTETISIDWSFNSTPTSSGNANSSRTIEIGDTVTWVWYASGNHNVVRNGGTSSDAFNSGSTVGQGSTFSHTFNSVGTNDYVCSPHASIMFGTITVVPEGALSINDFELELNKFKLSPNPSKNNLNVEINYNSENDYFVEVYDVLGKQIFKTQLKRNITNINVSNWRSGVYLVKLSSDQTTLTKRFMKQ
ncbi:T9SS type A sorting domain-containing protein [Winogradskyella litorisediminis]|uniref:T9SS type A sorting domain-containing protein n=1 Tax=Winogradskyella litorisediminis TaxID=1156618 RepID=A0ABW3NCJ5_9FLAO